jgi:hypothetical protein
MESYYFCQTSIYQVVKVDNRTKDSVRTILSFFISFCLLAKGLSIGHSEKETLFTWGTTISTGHRPIKCPRWTIGQRTLFTLIFLSLFLSAGRRLIRLALGKRDSVSHWVLLPLLLGIGLIKCQKKNCVHKEDHARSAGYRPLTWTMEISFCSHRRVLFLSFSFSIWPNTYQVDIGKRLLSHGRLLFLLTITAIRCLRWTTGKQDFVHTGG